MSNICKYLKELRLRQNLSMDDVARMTGIADSTLSNLENGKIKRPLSIDVISKLACAYKINVIELLTASGEIPKSQVEQYVRVFSGTEQLTLSEKQYVQEMINYILSSHTANKGGVGNAV